jgi:protein-disulfide isomerase
MRFDKIIAPHARFVAVAGAFLIGALGYCAPAAAEFSADQKAEIGKIVRDYLVTNPEVVRDAIDELEKRQKLAEASNREKAITKNSSALFNSPHQTIVGNPAGDVTVVEFFDYNCGYCKQALNNLVKLTEADPKVKVILKDFPILGSDSVDAATIAAAAREQLKGAKYWEFHRKLLSVKGHVGKAQALAVAKELGADVDKLEKDAKSPSIAEGFKEVETLAEELRFNGTPSWVVGADAVVGGLPYAELKQRVDNVRKCGKAAC